MRLHKLFESVNEVSKSMLNRYKKAARSSENKAGLDQFDARWNNEYYNDSTGATGFRHMDDWSDEDREAYIQGGRTAKKRRKGLAVAQAKTAKNGKNLGSGEMRGYKAKVRATDESLEENKLLKVSKLSSDEYQRAKKLKGFDKSAYTWNSSDQLYHKKAKNESEEVARLRQLAGIKEERIPVERGSKEHHDWVEKKKDLERQMKIIITGEDRDYYHNEKVEALKDPQKKADYEKVKAEFDKHNNSIVVKNAPRPQSARSQETDGRYVGGRNRYTGD